MARPLKEGLDYFPHDVDSSSDDKLETLEAVYGNDGYAAYFKLLERIYRNGGKIFISDAETMQKYSKRCNIADFMHFEKMINTMAKIGLFNEIIWKDAKALTSNGILKRVQIVTDKRVKMKERHSSRVSAAETQQKVHKVKERKEKKRKALPPKNTGQIDPLKTIDEDIKNFQAIGMTDKWIKDHYLTMEIPEAEIDLAMGKKF